MFLCARLRTPCQICQLSVFIVRPFRIDTRFEGGQRVYDTALRLRRVNKEIGARLNTNERNVKRAVPVLFRKFKVRNRVSLIYETDRRCLQALISASRSVQGKR
jgi:hypothetical protein